MAKRNTTGLPKPKKKQTRQQDEAQQQGEGQEDGPLRRIANPLGDYKDPKQREQHIQRLIVFGGGAVLVLLAVSIVAGIVWEQVIVPRQAVAFVNGEAISVSEFQERVRLERLIINQRFYNDIPFLQGLGLISDPNQILQQEPYSTQFNEITQQPELLGSRVLNDMIDERIIRQAAADLGVTADAEAVDERVEEFFNFVVVTEEPDTTEEATEEAATNTPTPFVSPTPSSTPTQTPPPSATPTPLEATEEVVAAATADVTEDAVVPTSTPRPTNTPTATPSNEERRDQFTEQIDLFYQDARQAASLSEDVVRSYFEFEVLLQALRDEVTTDVDPMAPFVNARHILVGTQAEADEVIAALEAGESFADLAQAVSIDNGDGTGGSAARGGELGWSPAVNYVDAFRDAVVDAEIGAVVGPVESDFGFHIIQVRAREERELSENEFERAKNSAFNDWLEETTNDEANEIERRDNWPAHVPLDPPFDPLRVVDPAEGAA
jgi:cell division septation protein DedD